MIASDIGRDPAGLVITICAVGVIVTGVISIIQATRRRPRP